MYLIKTPRWLPALFPRRLVWKMPATGAPAVYLTFDDGPHATATPFVLDQLKAFKAKATFFCIGKNVASEPELYRRIIAEGHATGNHTQHHLNGWKTSTMEYIKNIQEADKLIDSRLFRPPYGRIKRRQVSALCKESSPKKIIMWDVLSADFDTQITPQTCLNNVLQNISPGSIIVFHDSAKAWERMSYALPRILQYCNDRSWDCRSIN